MGPLADYLVTVGHQTGAEMKVGLAKRLVKKYEAKYEREFAVFLGAAVTNSVFSEAPQEPRAVQFVQQNMQLIEKEAENISADDRLCQLLTSSVYSLSYDLPPFSVPIIM